VALANGIQRYLRGNNRPEINFMQKNSPVFPLFQKGIDAKMKGFFYFSRIGDYVLNWSNTSFPCFMNIKALGCASSFKKVHKTWKTRTVSDLTE
jgi:hypothetical protein